MQYQPMAQAVQQRGELTGQAAESVLAATVQALLETSSGGEMRDLQAQLPEPLKSITPAGSQTDRSVLEFCARVSELSAVDDPRDAQQAVHTVMEVLHEAVTPGQLHQLVDALPSGYAQLLPSTQGLDPSAEHFAERVRARAELSDTEQALTVVHAVLAVLAERIHRGQATDLLDGLPRELHPTLPETDHDRPEFDRGDFLAKVAERAQLGNTAQAEVCTRAVLSTLLDRAPHQTHQTRDQLPGQLAELIDLEHDPAQRNIP